MLSSRAGLAILVLSAVLHASPQQTNSAVQSGKTIPSSKPAKGSEYLSSERLLRRAYLLSKEVPVEDRVWLLAELTMPSAKWHPALIRPWAEEQFRLAEQLSPDYSRLATQKNAATAMSWIDLRRALQLLEQCDSPISSEDDVEDLRGVAARRIFKQYWDRAPAFKVWQIFSARQTTSARPGNIPTPRWFR